ncbi:multiple epidermal growth factor-like domains protein 11 [Symsagittifera roscoffensis]|uniref:multiple epidermal growth factor-like domains protein 11 n=1 Tax=Symsagittifera roscoffensis TaxID=84072 RepID=UPI00307C5055
MTLSLVKSLVVFGVLIVVVSCDVSEGTSNACQKRTSVNEEERVCEDVAYTERYKAKCWNLFKWFSCTKTRTAYHEECRMEPVTTIVITWECCSGYQETSNRRCRPVCSSGCENGDCIAPDNCRCHDGFRGISCDSSCQPGSFGPSCANSCSCENGADCDPIDGSCTCAAGYIGHRCEQECDEWKHGLDCVQDCVCLKNQTQFCENTNGRCTCKSGYQGALCDSLCPEGLTGVGCEQVCPCQNDAICLPEEQGCQCTPGFSGEVCADPCEEDSWGADCTENCLCFNGGDCNPKNGTCTCSPGFFGINCQRECDLGFWGDRCSGNCSHCSFGMPCDFRNGTCLCNEFQKGDNCEILSCPEGKYGPACFHNCLCQNNATCDMVTGSCECLALGFTGPYCSQECPNGTFGVNCSQECNCTMDFCDSVVGCVEISKRDQQFGEVSSDDIPWMVVTCILGVFFVLLAAGGGFFVWKRFSRKMKPKKPPAGYPPERNGFVNPTLAKKEEDKEAGIYISSNSEIVAYSSAASVSGQDDPCTSSAPRPEDDKEYSLTDDGTKMQMDRDNSINEKNSLKGPSQIQKQTSCDNEYADINTLDNEAPKHDDQTQNHASSNESAPDFDNDDYQGIESHYSKIQLLESKTDKISSEVDSEKEAYVNPCSETDMGNYDAYNIVSPLHNDMYVEPNKEKSNASKDESSTKTEQVTTYKRTNEGGVCHDTEYVDGLSDYADLGDN